MSDPFSIVAGSFAVLGVVDVVLRANVACSRFLSAIRDAPGEIDRLRTYIEESKVLIEAFMKHLNGSRTDSTPVAAPMNEALSLFKSSIKVLSRELSFLRNLEARHKGTNKIWSACKFHLDERKVSNCLRRFKHAKSTLCTALLLIEGYVTPVCQPFYQSELKFNRKQAALNRKTIVNTTKQGFEHLNTTISIQNQDLSLILSNQSKVMNAQESLVYNSKLQTRHATLVRQELRKADKFDRTQHAKTRAKIAEGNQVIIDTISSKLMNLRVNVLAAMEYTREDRFMGKLQEITIDKVFKEIIIDKLFPKSSYQTTYGSSATTPTGSSKPDVTLKASVKCYQFLTDIEDAPAEIESLRTCLKDDTAVIKILKRHVEDMRSPDSPTFIPAPELLPTINQFSAAVTAF
ncbi:hypothetical protein N0V90_006341 [Kalmusia sp. IMI 367209]|nr:hypothetical protein N0V90_006341 [Kalmusia sp. IMI 367209]